MNNSLYWKGTQKNKVVSIANKKNKSLSNPVMSIEDIIIVICLNKPNKDNPDKVKKIHLLLKFIVNFTIFI